MRPTLRNRFVTAFARSGWRRRRRPVAGCRSPVAGRASAAKLSANFDMASKNAAVSMLNIAAVQFNKSIVQKKSARFNDLNAKRHRPMMIAGSLSFPQPLKLSTHGASVNPNCPPVAARIPSSNVSGKC
ncbi:hypothetical protein RCH14_002084 [Massilia sp. MP_M2]|uniref:hypothetical protein n=1 Tax=Massilia sp. MP_M2 TaxID=3071713 RepID=UPI00319E2B36